VSKWNDMSTRGLLFQ